MLSRSDSTDMHSSRGDAHGDDGPGRARAHSVGGGLLRASAEETMRFHELAEREALRDEPAAGFFDVIERDLHRTFPRHEMFTEASGVGQSEMRKVLYAYGRHNPSLGYCQGMGMVAGLLLMHTSSEMAFAMFKRIVESVRRGGGGGTALPVCSQGAPLSHSTPAHLHPCPSVLHPRRTNGLAACLRTSCARYKSAPTPWSGSFAKRCAAFGASAILALVILFRLHPAPIADA